MSKKMLLFTSLTMMILSSCIQETVVITPAITAADVQYEFWSGPSGTLVEGEVYNDGETYINSVELQVDLYDYDGYYVNRQYFWIETYTRPGQFASFTLDLYENYIYDVSVRVVGYR